MFLPHKGDCAILLCFSCTVSPNICKSELNVIVSGQDWFLPEVPLIGKAIQIAPTFPKKKFESKILDLVKSE